MVLSEPSHEPFNLLIDVSFSSHVRMFLFFLKIFSCMVGFLLPIYISARYILVGMVISIYINHSCIILLLLADLLFTSISK